ncbi:MAG: acetyl-CoA carboxylase biotin carboxyl carrier protein [Candidatus Eisenbacteria bacterium]|uniref:Biotin carboxyl carrier protein of acetyl-CoA carboxylase n=1 Tax=Eiseniibacteriota bacterium TaxID=2212470 RepID=A0A948W322_UNCEI|nr:acetyl-CoA carboxylase biotin carboxyl carrier protein [Candidatus Eisenbacteria bacterium]MBU1951206.1 acetyl-CoA carboxylase biotin carboxyl carrier protein [Candidatus Eisenbacteria bacterium]MBU2690607.1 acetyl-CoA carboxylase biotin carboxyl carrier protein [Candidatus Eisenbacteria bacterium]
MDVEELKRLIRLVEESQIDELEIRKLWSRVRITKAGALGLHPSRADGGGCPASEPMVVSVPSIVTPAAPAPVGKEPEVDEGLVPIVSPIVGTFYRAPSPDAAPYSDVGTRVSPGQVVCIVEAMKLMNEIEAEVSGTVERILVENTQPVEFNQPLFLVRPDAS